VWPQCWDLKGPRGIEQRDLRNLNLGDLKKGPNGGVSPTPQKKRYLDMARSGCCCVVVETGAEDVLFVCASVVDKRN
jgi:predicted transcriptional regulator